MKKFLFLFLIIFPLHTFAFSDIQSSEFRPYIENMANEKLISGYSNGLFYPNNHVSFVESLKISINTAHGSQHIDEFQQWEDVYKDIYNQKYSQKEKIFANNEKISRDFAIYIILKNIGINLENVTIGNNFSDVNTQSIFSNYINFAKNNNIISGYGDGRFGAKNFVTRGEFTKMSWLAIREKQQLLQESFSNIKNQKPETSKKITTKIASVTDGDTIKVYNNMGGIDTIRVLGIDAPESFATRFGYIECFGNEASNFLKNYLPQQAEVEIIYYGDDKYKRDLAEIFYKWESIAKTMVKNGYAWVYKDGIQPSNFSELILLEQSLRGSNVGLWSSKTCHWERRKATRYIPPKETITPVQPIKTTYEKNTQECYIKGNINKKWEKIYHMPNGKYYSQTIPEACFSTESEAINSWFRASKV